MAKNKPDNGVFAKNLASIAIDSAIGSPNNEERIAQWASNMSVIEGLTVNAHSHAAVNHHGNLDVAKCVPIFVILAKHINSGAPIEDMQAGIIGDLLEHFGPATVDIKITIRSTNNTDGKFNWLPSVALDIITVHHLSIIGPDGEHLLAGNTGLFCGDIESVCLVKSGTGAIQFGFPSDIKGSLEPVPSTGMNVVFHRIAGDLILDTAYFSNKDVSSPLTTFIKSPAGLSNLKAEMSLQLYYTHLDEICTYIEESIGNGGKCFALCRD